jgi:DNA primase
MEATDIVEVIGEFVQLKKRGANYVGFRHLLMSARRRSRYRRPRAFLKIFRRAKGAVPLPF